jgi:hypothetical protein
LNWQRDNLLPVNEFDKIPKGRHRAVLTLYPATGRAVKQDLSIDILPDKINTRLSACDLPRVSIRPVNSKEKTVLATEVKIESIPHFVPFGMTPGIVCSAPQEV